MLTADFDYTLPPELIAQFPAERRDASRLLVMDRATDSIAHKNFRDFQTHLRPGDVLVLNNSRVIPARLRGVNEKTGGKFEVLLLEENSPNDWWAMMRPGKRAPVGTRIIFQNHSGALTNITAEVIAINEEGHRRLRFGFKNNENIQHSTFNAEHRTPATDAPQPVGSSMPARDLSELNVECSHEFAAANILDALTDLGELPLPPYIERAAGKTSDTDLDRYQTVFAQPAGSVAAPTAGLHFTPELLDELRAHGVEVCFVTLHVGLGTFAPVKADSLAEHVMHEERFEVSEAVANTVNTAKREGRRVIAVGTTSVRVLESAAASDSPSMNLVAADVSPLHMIPRKVGADSRRLLRSCIRSGPGRTRIFIHPPHHFKIVDALLTNFHLPRSTLLMLVSAFAAPGELRGRDFALRAYAEAVIERYRFFSYGDAMFIQ